MREERKVGYSRLLAALTLVAGCVVQFSSAGSLAAERNGAESRRVVARVNGQPIYYDQLQPRIKKSQQALLHYGIRKDDTRLRRRVQAKVLDQAIGDLLINQGSKKRTIENIDEKVEQRVK